MDNRNLICKNDLIDCTKKYKPIELKVFYNMLYCYKEQCNYDVDLNESEITYMPISKIENYLGNKHFTLTEIINIIRNLPKDIYSKDGKEYISVFNKIKYNEENEEFEFIVCNEFKDLVDNVIRNFTVLELGCLSNLQSSYSQRIFEFVSKNKNLKEYLMPIQEFREYFNVPKSYNMCNIDQRVINPCMYEINTKTNFKIDMKKIKKNNIVTHIKFVMESK